jgi:hypothetical protein
MKLSDLQQQWHADCQIDKLSLDSESLKLPNLHSKYITYWNEETLNYKRLQGEYKIIYKLKWEYYNGKLSLEDLKEHQLEPFHLKILKQDIDIYIDSDKNIIDIQAKIDYTKQKINFLDSIIKHINTRGYLIKNAIDFMKFQLGS